MKLQRPYETLLVVSILAVFFVDEGMPSVNDAADAFAELVLSSREVCSVLGTLAFCVRRCT
jgi:hypothetical protein